MELSVEEIAKRRGFFWPAFEIYGGCSGFYTYGPVGSLLKLRIEEAIRKAFVIEEGCMEISAPALTPEQPWVASGHTESFADMITECEKCSEPYRADHLLEEKTKTKTEGMSLADVQQGLEKIKCPKCGGKLGKAYNYNLMFKTLIGPGKGKTAGALRPETAQTTYMPFRRLFEIGRKKIPFGVIQFGRSYRNEISPRKALVRLREFTQAEAQFFVSPEHKNEWKKFSEVKNMKVLAWTKEMQKKNQQPVEMRVSDIKTSQIIAYFLAKAIMLYKDMGMDEKKLRVRQHRDDERSFYSADTWDVEFLSENYGRVELVGVADRTDYDLKRHMQFSKHDMSVNIDGKKFVPHVVEVAFGIDRPVLCIMESCLKSEKERTFFSFPASVSPYQAAVFPLVRKEGLPEKAMEIFDMLRKTGIYVAYDETGSIGRMYYRQDEIGTPFCITVDFDTLKNDDVTVRDRDTQKQVRVKIKDLPKKIISMTENGF